MLTACYLVPDNTPFSRLNKQIEPTRAAVSEVKNF